MHFKRTSPRCHKRVNAHSGQRFIGPVYLIKGKFWSEILGNCLNNKEAKDFAYQGFGRRIGVIRRCIENIHRICPPDINLKPKSDELSDLAINLQAFVLNVYGALDNLAWVWVKEMGIVGKNSQPLPKQQIGFSVKYPTVRKSFSKKFQEYLATRADWFEKLENFRHALAHRIPLYVPPCSFTDDEIQKWQKRQTALRKHEFDAHSKLTNEIEGLGTFIPVMTHSYEEQASMALLSQNN